MKGKVFTAQEVQAMLNGSKIMFREVIKPQPDNTRQQFSTIVSSTMRGESGKHRFVEVENLNIITHTKSFKCPYQVGQKIFCKESFCEKADQETLEPLGEYWYKADGKEIFKMDYDGFTQLRKDGSDASPWKSPIHMKQEHSRLTLLIKDIKVERLQDISEEDAIAEGIPKIGFHDLLNREQSNSFLSRIFGKEYKYYPQEFRKLWNATHKKPEEKFEASPWVWVYQFELIK